MEAEIKYLNGGSDEKGGTFFINNVDNELDQIPLKK